MKKKLFSLAMSVVMAVTAIVSLPFSITALAQTTYTIDVVNGENITAKLNAALSNALDSEEPIKVVVPAGNYTTSSGIRVYSNTYLEMTGATISRDNFNGIMLRVGAYGTANKGYDYYKNITIHGGTLDSKGAVASNDGGIFTADHTTNITIDGVKFLNCRDSHHITFAGCNNATVKNCSFSGSFRTEKKNVNLEAIQLDILQKSHYKTGNDAAYDGTMNKNINITANTFNNVSRGVGCHSVFAGKYMDNISITSNTFTNIHGYAVSAVGMHGVKITGNKMTNCGSGIFYRTLNSGKANNYKYGTAVVKDNATVISGNTIHITKPADAYYNVVPYGIKVYGATNTTESGLSDGTLPSGDYRAYGLTINNNVINIDYTCYGIWLYGAVGTKINSNNITFYNKGFKCDLSQGIKCEKSTGLNIAYNKLNGSRMAHVSNGIYLVSSSSGNVDNNTVMGFKKNGILLETSCSANIRSNVVTNNVGYGICVRNASKGALSSNNVYKNSSYGIFFNNTNKANTSNKDISKNNSGYGIDCNKANVKITSVNCSNNGNYGIFCNNSAKVTISGGTVASNKGHGIYFSTKASGSVKKTNIKSNKKYGIYIAKGSKKVTVSKVKYSKNKSGKIKK